MTAAPELRHVVPARNSPATTSRQTDASVRALGFAGRHVPGAEVYGYMAHLVVQQLGADWLRRGSAEVRFLKPVYEGRDAVASGIVGEDSALDLRVTVDGTLCATAFARLEDETPAPSVDAVPRAPLPADLLEATPESLRPGTVLGTFEMQYGDDEQRAYLQGAAETLPLYTEQKITHPGLILRLGNRVLTSNRRMGAWLYAGSRIRHYATAGYGDRLAARGTVLAEYERKGHRFVDLDVLVTTNDETVVARIHHTAIYRTRSKA